MIHSLNSGKVEIEVNNGVIISTYVTPYNEEHPRTISVKLPDDVVVMSESTFYAANSVREVIIPEGVKIIKSGACRFCENIKRLVFPSTVEVIESEAFFSLPALAEIVIADNPRFEVIDGCLIEKATKSVILCAKNARLPLDKDIERLSAAAIQATQEGEIVLPDTLLYVEPRVFQGCEKLSLNEHEGGYYIPSKSNPYFLFLKADKKAKKVVLHPDTRILADEAFSLSKVEEVVLSKWIGYIPHSAFYHCRRLRSVTFAEKNDSSRYDDMDKEFGVGEYAFYHCAALEKVEIPSRAYAVISNAFRDCLSLKSIDLSSIKTIGGFAFAEGGLEEILLPNEIESIDVGAFSATKLKSVNIPKGIKTIYWSTFQSCKNLTEITIPEGVERIEVDAFESCKALKRVTLPSTLKFIGNGAFYNTAIESIDLPAVEKIEGNAFGRCKRLSSITVSGGDYSVVDGSLIKGDLLVRNFKGNLIPEGVKTIGEGSFSGRRGLKIKLPASVEEIYENAFEDCSSLTITLSDNLSYVGEYAIPYRIKNANGYKGGFYAPSESNPYFMLLDFAEPATEVAIHRDTVIIGSHVFDDTGVEVLKIPEKVKQIGDSSKLNELKSFISQPDGALERIGSGVLEGNNLLNVKLSSKIKYVGLKNRFKSKSIRVRLFDGAKYLGNKNEPFLVLIGLKNNSKNSYKLHEGTKIIAARAFENTELTKIEMNEGLIRIGASAFSGCYNLKDVKLPSTLEYIGRAAFANCPKIENAVIPDSVKTIMPFAFSSSGLNRIELGKGVRYLGSSQFDFCDYLEELTLPASLEEIDGLICYACSSLKRIKIPAKFKGADLTMSCDSLKDVEYYE